jgi:hypothetical protein
VVSSVAASEVTLCHSVRQADNYLWFWVSHGQQFVHCDGDRVGTQAWPVVVTLHGPIDELRSRPGAPTQPLWKSPPHLCLRSL